MSGCCSSFLRQCFLFLFSWWSVVAVVVLLSYLAVVPLVFLITFEVTESFSTCFCIVLLYFGLHWLCASVVVDSPMPLLLCFCSPLSMVFFKNLYGLAIHMVHTDLQSWVVTFRCYFFLWKNSKHVWYCKFVWLLYNYCHCPPSTSTKFFLLCGKVS